MKAPLTMDAAVIALLVAAGFVTRDKVEESRRLARSFGIFKRKPRRAKKSRTK